LKANTNLIYYKRYFIDLNFTFEVQQSHLNNNPYYSVYLSLLIDTIHITNTSKMVFVSETLP